MAEGYASKYVKEFTQQMHLQLGMRVLVFLAHHDSNGVLSLARQVDHCFGYHC